MLVNVSSHMWETVPSQLSPLRGLGLPEVWPSEGGHKEFAPRQEGSQNLQSEMMKCSVDLAFAVEEVVWFLHHLEWHGFNTV